MRQQLQFPLAQRELDLALNLSHDPATRVRIENYQKASMPSRVTALKPFVRYLCLAGYAHEDPEHGGSLKEAIAFYEAASNKEPGFDLIYQQLKKNLTHYELHYPENHFVLLILFLFW